MLSPANIGVIPAKCIALINNEHALINLERADGRSLDALGRSHGTFINNEGADINNEPADGRSHDADDRS